MPSSERSPSKRGSSRKASVNPLSVDTTPEQRVRDTQYPAEDLALTEDEAEASNLPRLPKSAIRFNQPITRRSSRNDNPDTQRPTSYVPARRTQKQDPGLFSPSARSPRNTTAGYADLLRKRGPRNIHWLFYVGLSLVAILALWALGAAVLGWGTNVYNNVLYGYPRTYQTDAVVGHGDSTHNPSHFIAVNLHGQIIIVEFPGGDPSKSTDYIGPELIGPQDDLLPVTLSFGDYYHTGKIDMVVHVSDKSFIFCNNGTKFTACDASNQSPPPTPTP